MSMMAISLVISRRSTNLAVLLVAVTAVYTAADFAEYPMNITLTIGFKNNAVFRCRHQSVEAIIGWRVNESPLGLFLDISQRSIPENGTLVSTLTIPVRSEYNETRVVCDAVFRNGSLPEVTPSVTLTILPDESPTLTIATTSAAGTTSTEPPPTLSSIDFTQVPSPSLLIVTLNERHIYKCQHSQTNRILWQLNGSRITSTISLPQGINIGSDSLIIESRVELNDTTIQCIAELNGVSVETSNVTFRIQGLLQGVTDIMRNAGTLSWEAPFSLNLTNADPDIVYCVEVVNITCGRNLLISECDVMETNYSNDALLSGYIYEYTVTPRSNVERASNGISAKVTEEFILLKLSLKGHQFTMGNQSDTVIVISHLDTYDIQMNNHRQVLADSYAILLDSLDGVDDDDRLKVIPNVIRSQNSTIGLQVTLPYRRLWNYTVLAHGCEQHPVTSNTIFSTYDVQSILVTSPNPGDIRVTGRLIQESTATSIMITDVSSSGTRFYLLAREKDQLELDGIISNLISGQHIVSAFVVDGSGLPFNRTATLPQKVLVMQGSGNQIFSIEYELVSIASAGGVCIRCNFLDPSASKCVAIVHRRISQLSSGGLMNIESSHKFNRSGDTAYGCIEGVNLAQYQVGVVGGTPLMEESRTSETTEASPYTSQRVVAAVTVVVLLVVVIVVGAMLALVFLYRARLKKRLRFLVSSNRQNEYRLNTLTAKSIDNESSIDNQSAYPSEKGYENVSLLRTQADSSITPPPTLKQDQSDFTETVASDSTDTPIKPTTDAVVYDEIKELKSEQESSLVPVTASTRVDTDSSAIVYAEMAVSKLRNVPTPPATENVVYNEIKMFNSEQDPHSTPKVQVEETEIKQPIQVQEAPSPIPFTLEYLISKLLPHASKWQSLGEALSLDDDRLDEIYTNNETDEACLQEMLEVYVARSDLNHNWDEIQEAIKTIPGGGAIQAGIVS